MDLRFQALEYGDDQGFHPVEMRYRGSTEAGWEIDRNGHPHLHLGPGYRLLRTTACGVCSTDLARHHLPFPLPQITGHEVLALDDDGQRYSVEINASHLARGIDSDCEFCNEGMDTHCPDRLVLGIHDLPGGFGPWILAPREALVPIPDSTPDETALLLEPFAAAFHIEDICDLERHSRIAVLGPRRLGQLVIAALAVQQRQLEMELHVTALTRHAALADLALRLGADEATVFEGAGQDLPSSGWDLVIDTTGTPAGLDLALRLAAHEVHLKSTHGLPAVGLTHITEMVVDELSLQRMPDRPAAWNAHLRREPFGKKPQLLWTAEGPPPKGLANQVQITRSTPQEISPESLGSFDFAVAQDLVSVDGLIRPSPQREKSCLRPLGTLFLDLPSSAEGALATAIRDRDLRLSTSRCGDIDKSLHFLGEDPLGSTLGTLMMSHSLGAHEIARAFEIAQRPESLKVCVRHAMEDNA